MSAEQPSTSVDSTTAMASKPMGGSTKKMLVKFMVGICEAPDNTPATDRELVNGILMNDKIGTMQKSIEGLEADRNNTYSIQLQVAELAPNLEANTLIKPETKSQLKVRINNLLDLVKQGISIDANLTTLDAKASELQAQLLASLKAHFSKKPVESSVIVDRGTIAKTVEERTAETDRLTRSFTSLYNQIKRTYVETRDALPGTGPLNLKPLNTLSTPKAESESRKQIG